MQHVQLSFIMNATPTLITPADAARRGTPSDTVWLDVRSPVEYREVHLAGSRLVPLDAMQGPALASELAGKKVVIICRSGNRAKQAAATLAAAGHGDLAVLDGGVLAWQAAGLPVNRGQAGLSLERQVRHSPRRHDLSGSLNRLPSRATSQARVPLLHYYPSLHQTNPGIRPFKTAFRPSGVVEVWPIG